MQNYALYGGIKSLKQKKWLTDRTTDVLISTPGRLIDLLGDGYLSISNIDYLVLDEADRLLDMGFKP